MPPVNAPTAPRATAENEMFSPAARPLSASPAELFPPVLDYGLEYLAC